MSQDTQVTRDEAQAYYEHFSHAVGVRDWLLPNARHEQLKLLVHDILAGRGGLRILDVGCGAGVMTDHLRRYGDVTGIDFSGAAISAARRFTAHRFGSRPTFLTGSLEAISAGERFDLITLFDVMEHIQRDERPDFLRTLRGRLADGGLLFASTPHPAFTRHRREAGDATLQIVDEQVELPALMAEAAAADLQLIGYRAFDVFAGSPEYQSILLTTARAPGGSAALRDSQLARRMRILRSGPARRGLELARAARLALAGEWATARTVLREPPPDVRS